MTSSFGSRRRIVLQQRFEGEVNSLEKDRK